jgi:hypothetical protein
MSPREESQTLLEGNGQESELVLLAELAFASRSAEADGDMRPSHEARTLV